uniref:Ig-like domain-containing protein n=1 Tax=Labrus bergylta TaxID=56723 RepID=A0A3Q3F3S4_9LABR
MSVRWLSLTHDAALTVTVVLDVLYFTVIQGQTGWRVTYSSTKVCALRGSTVVLRCTYSYPSTTTVQKSFWFTEVQDGEPVDLQTDSQYTGRVTYSSKSKDCTLTITNVGNSDSAVYKFRFITNHQDGSYTGDPESLCPSQVIAGQHSIEVEMTCHSSCSEVGRLSYVWFRNKQKITRAVTSTYKGWFYLEDEISCALNGHDRFPSPSVLSPSAEIVENSTVTLTCSSDANPAANYTWYKKNGNPDFQPLSKGPELVFSSVQSSDSGEFYCAAENDLGRRTSEHFISDVKYAPKLPSVSVSPSAEIVEGSSVTLTCSSDANPAPEYTWFKENNNQPLSREAQLVFSSIKSSDSGEYLCKAENDLGKPTYKWISIDVKCDITIILIFFVLIFYINLFFNFFFLCIIRCSKVPSVSVSPSAEIVEGSSVTLTCSSDANPLHCTVQSTNMDKETSSLLSSNEILTGNHFENESSGQTPSRTQLDLHLINDLKQINDVSIKLCE